jgi:PAS domain S-box-containing protein
MSSPSLVIQIASLAVALVHLGLGVRTLFENPRHRANRLFAALCLSFFAWSACYGLFVVAPDELAARSWSRLGAFGWGASPALLLHFALVFTRRRVVRISNLLLTLVYLPALLVLGAALRGPVFAKGYLLTPWGWAEQMDPGSPLYWIFIAYYVGSSVAAFTLIWLWGFRSTMSRERGCAWIMVTSGLCCVVLATLLTYLRPVHSSVEMPGLSHFATLICSGGMGVALHRSRLLQLTPESAAQAVLSGMSEAVLLLDAEHHVLFANPAAGALLEQSRHRLLGRSLQEVGGEELARFVDEGVERASAEPVAASEHELKLPSGDWRFIRLRALPMADPAGQRYGAALIVENITEQGQLRQRLERADAASQRERLATVGMLAASVAHEINNPLGYVMANLELLADALRVGRDVGPAELGGLAISELSSATEEALEGAGRVRDIVADLRSFSRAERPDVTGPVDLVGVLESALALARNELRHRARVVRELEPLPSIEANDGRLCQVFLNLLINAAHAIEPGHSAEHRVILRSRVEPDWLVIEVEDTGAGIDSRDLVRIFEPFHSSRRRSEGLGLGLPISRRIVEELGGRIEVSSELGQGSCFRVLLPRALQLGAAPGDAAPVEPPRDLATPSPPGTGQPVSRVLFVDDEAALLRVMSRVASRRYQVLTASSGLEAQALLREGAEVDLVVSDLMMAEGSGMELHAWIRQHRPALAETMLFLSGGAFSAEAAAFADRFQDRLVSKPFGGPELLDALERALG